MADDSEWKGVAKVCGDAKALGSVQESVWLINLMDRTEPKKEGSCFRNLMDGTKPKRGCSGSRNKSDTHSL